MKKFVSVCLALCLTAAFGTTAFAHGHHRGQATQSYAVCPYEDCLEAGYHTHDDTTYCGHYDGDGHDYHGYHNGGYGCYGGGCH